MRVFVDSLKPRRPTPHAPWSSACHLLSDNLPDLREFAARLRLRLDWLQWSRGGTPFYCLTPALRLRAVLLDAIIITSVEAGLLARFWRRRDRAILNRLARASALAPCAGDTINNPF